MPKPSMFVKLTAQPGKRPEVLAAFDRMLAAVESEPGTEVYTVHLDNADEDSVWVFESYADDEALAAHSSSPAMQALMADLGSLLGGGAILAATTTHAGKGIGS